MQFTAKKLIIKFIMTIHIVILTIRQESLILLIKLYGIIKKIIVFNLIIALLISLNSKKSYKVYKSNIVDFNKKLIKITSSKKFKIIKY